MHSESFGPPRELLEVYARERGAGLATESLESWLRKRAYGHCEVASAAERPHCRAAMGTPTREGKPGPRFRPR